MKRLGFYVLAATAVMATAGCSSKPAQQPVVEDETIEYVPLNRDSTLYGLCGEESTVNTLQLLVDNGDTVVVSVEEADANGQVLGGYAVGDRMAVILGPDRRTAQMVLNQSTLLGEWVMPNPLDGSSDIGIRIKEGGIVEGIEQSSVIYRTWRIFNGKLELVSVRDGGGDVEETNLYDILKLGEDSLIFKDQEDLFEYGRKQDKPGYGEDIILEEASEDDYRI